MFHVTFGRGRGRGLRGGAIAPAPTYNRALEWHVFTAHDLDDDDDDDRVALLGFQHRLRFTVAYITCLTV